jgi:iron complex outermembrane receptor protein
MPSAQKPSAQSSAQEDVSSDTSATSIADADAAALSDESLESLMNVTVTSVSRKAELFSDVPAALTVITQEDIRRSGFTNLPEVLRLVPGLYVGRISAHKWAISARGFSTEFANKLLVLIDGRTVYNPAFSGVYWDAQDIMLEDVERIEVIRGPGASVWGANAVNGVINIITKSAKDTQGGLLTGRIGTKESNGAFRYGTKIGKNAFGRFYVKRSEYGETVRPTGADGNDVRDLNRAGFRVDWDKSVRDSFTFQGDINRSKADDIFSVINLAAATIIPTRGKVTDNSMNLLGRWTRILGKDSDMSLQMYYDRSDHRILLIDNKTEQFDIDFNHRFRLNPRHEIVWGLGYRKTNVNFRNSFEVSINPAKDQHSIYSAFVQDDITLKEDKLRLVLGTKVEHNSFTGFELQPSGRLVWTPNSKQTVWAAVSRAVRTPSFIDRGLRANLAVFPNPEPTGPPILGSLFGTPTATSETLLAHEIGYRVQPNDRLIIDATAYFNRYNHFLIGTRSSVPIVELDPLPPHLVFPTYYANNGKGTTRGFEISSIWKISDRWKLTGNYSWFQANLTTPSTKTPGEERQYPNHMMQIRSSHDLPHNLTFDVFASLSSRHEPLDAVVPSHTRVDMRLGWKPSSNLDLSVGVQNLTSRQHQESQSPTDVVREVPRNVYIQGTWKF